MSTSGTYTITNTAQDIVTSALQVCGAVDVDQPLETIDLNTGLNDLNRLVKYLQSRGANLWKETEGVLFLDEGKTSYRLGPSGDECCDYDDFVATTTDAAEALGQTIISVTSTTGFTNSDNIGIELDDGTRHWTTISSFVANDTVTIAVALPSAAASGNSVYVFTSLIPRPLMILDNARFQETQSGNEIQINRWSKSRYMNQPDKTSTGSVVSDIYQPLLTNGIYYVWQPASNVKSVVKFTYYKPIEIFSNTANNPDFPAEWFMPLIYSLAVSLAPQYRVDAEQFQIIRSLRDEYMADVEGFDTEQAALQVVPG